jgi:hypothetical protein
VDRRGRPPGLPRLRADDGEPLQLARERRRLRGLQRADGREPRREPCLDAGRDLVGGADRELDPAARPRAGGLLHAPRRRRQRPHERRLHEVRADDEPRPRPARLLQRPLRLGVHARPGGLGAVLGRHPQPELPRLSRDGAGARREPRVRGEPRARAGDPARTRGVGCADGRHGRPRLPAPHALGHDALRPLLGGGTSARGPTRSRCSRGRSRSTPWARTLRSRSRRPRRPWASLRPPTSSPR